MEHNIANSIQRAKLFKQQFEKLRAFEKHMTRLLTNPDEYMKLAEVKFEEAEKEIKQLKLFMQEAVYSSASRSYIVKSFATFIAKMLQDEHFNKQTGIKDINELIDFKNIFNNCDWILFELLLDLQDVTKILKEHEVDYIFTAEKLCEIAKLQETDIKGKYCDESAALYFVALILFSIEKGHSVIDTLRYHMINEVEFSRVDHISIDWGGEKYYLEFLSFPSQAAIENILRQSIRGFSEDNPMKSDSLLNGNRVTAAAYSKTPKDEFYYHERLFNDNITELDELVHKYKTLSPRIAKIFKYHQAAKGGTLITGRDANLGKTTLAKALSSLIPQKWGIGLIDSNNEINYKGTFPQKNTRTLLAETPEDIEACSNIMFKMNRNVGFPGETIEPPHVGMILKWSRRFDAAALTTLHSKHPKYAVPNLVQLALLLPNYRDRSVAEEHIASAFDFITHLERHRDNKKRIIIQSITELQPYEHDYHIQLKTEGALREIIKHTFVMLQHFIFARFFKKNYIEREIIRFDYNLDEWVILNKPSEKYFEDCRYHLSEEEVEDYKSLFETGDHVA